MPHKSSLSPDGTAAGSVQPHQSVITEHHHLAGLPRCQSPWTTLSTNVFAVSVDQYQKSTVYVPELSMGWVDPWVGLGWVWVENFCFQWVGLGRGSEMADL